VGEGEVQQHRADAALLEVRDRRGQRRGVRQVEARRARLAQHLADEARVPGIVLDQKDVDPRCIHGRLAHALTGSLATLNQNASMALTVSTNLWRSTGLAT